MSLAEPQAEAVHDAAAPPDACSARWRRAALALLVLGVALQVWLWTRGSMELEITPEGTAAFPEGVARYGIESMFLDQARLLGPAVEVAEGGPLPPFAKQTSSEGVVPGALLPLVIGLPLRLAPEYLAASSLLLLVHLAAALLTLRVVRQAAGWRAAALFVAVFWLSPWRLYHSGFLWEPAYILLPAAVHLWAAWAQRTRGTKAASFWLGLTLTVAPQLHLSAAVLWLATGLQVVRRRFHAKLAPLAAGAVLGALTLLPTLEAALDGERVPVPTSGEESAYLPEAPLRSVKAALYWLRLGGGDIGRRIRQTGFYDGEGVAQALAAALAVLSILTVVVALLANRHAWRSRRAQAPDPGRAFLSEYAGVVFVAALAAAAISPATPQGWHLLIALPAASLPVTFWAADFLEKRGVRVVLAAAFAVRLAVVGLVGASHPMYQRPESPLAGPVAAPTSDSESPAPTD